MKTQKYSPRKDLIEIFESLLHVIEQNNLQLPNFDAENVKKILTSLRSKRDSLSAAKMKYLVEYEEFKSQRMEVYKLFSKNLKIIRSLYSENADIENLMYEFIQKKRHKKKETTGSNQLSTNSV